MMIEKVDNVIFFGTSHVEKNLIPKIKKIIDLEKTRFSLFRT